jgi:phospholipid/cholesterol/gamma-HCH transport system substrate-binding protein
LKISNESKIGALTAIAITLILLGYNYMASEGDFFKPTSHYFVNYTLAPGLTKGNKVLLNGYKVGFVQKISYQSENNTILATIKITEKLKIPKNSIAQIISEDILGSRAIKLILDTTNMKKNLFHTSGDLLLADVEINKLDELTRTVDPMVHKAEDILQYLDSFVVKSGKVEQMLDNTNLLITSIIKTSNVTSELIATNQNAIVSTLKNTKEITDKLNQNTHELTSLLKELHTFASDLNQHELASKTNELLTSVHQISAKIDSGDGTLGLLINQNTLHTQLEENLKNLNILLLDLQHHPEKYLPMPWGKKQRKKAKQASKNEAYQK